MNRRKEIEKLSDEQLLQSYQKTGGIELLSTLYLRYSPLVLGTCMKYLKNIEMAKDASVDIYEELLQKVKEHDIKSFKPWLYMVTRNHCLMLLRKNKRISMHTEEHFEHFEDDSELNLMLKKTAEEKLTLVEEAVEQLKDEQRKCIELFFFQSKSYAQISDELSLPIKKVKSAIQNGKRNIKLILEKSHVFRS